MTRTGTNLLGLVKHVASVEVGYFGEVFDRPSGIELPWFADGAPDNADLWATADESREQIVELHHRCAAHSDATIDALPLDAVGNVPWWGDRGRVTLHQMLVHMSVETARHAGHADIVRELHRRCGRHAARTTRTSPRSTGRIRGPPRGVRAGGRGRPMTARGGTRARCA